MRRAGTAGDSEAGDSLRVVLPHVRYRAPHDGAKEVHTLVAVEVRTFVGNTKCQVEGAPLIAVQHAPDER